MGEKKVFLSNSGTEAIEGAIKLVRMHTKRQYIIAFKGAFHGRTMGAISLNSSKVAQRAFFGPLVPGVIHIIPYPREEWTRCRRDPRGRSLQEPRRPEGDRGDLHRADPRRGRLCLAAGVGLA